MFKHLSVLGFAVLFGINTANAQNFSTHQVKKGETVEALAKQYYVTPSQIYALNPDAKKELKPNTILIIPISKANKPEVEETKELVGFKPHRVSKKETLYSLAKEYDVSEEDIKKHNKFLYAEPLRKGDKLQIPVFKVTRITKENDAVTTYIVKPKEGKWRVAYKFGITLKEFEELNPNLGDSLQVGQQVYVPNIANKDQKSVDEQYSYYKVLPKEGFYRLKVKLGLEQDALEMLNPELKETGLKEGMILKIPYSAALNGESASGIKRVDLTNKISDFSTKHIAIMLPFRLNRVDYDSVADTKRSIKSDPYLNASLDFHSGVLMAVDSLKKLGVSLKVDVYDTKHEVSEVARIINNNDFETVDAVIGPLTSNTFEKAATELRRYNTPIVSPIGTNLKLYDNVFQSRPSDHLLKSKIVNYVKSDSTAKNIVVISDTKNTAIANELKSEFTYARLVFSRKDKDGKDANYVMLDDIQNVLKPGKNYVFLETQSEGLASNATSILASLNQAKNGNSGIEIILVTTNFNEAFEGDEVSNEQLSRLHFHYATTAKSYSETDNNTFVKAYEKQYGITPNKRAVKGFDLTMDVALRLVTSENLYTSVNQSPLTEYVENKFAYNKELVGGYYNNAVYVVKYDNLNIVVVE
ncbi:PBP1 and LysM peptidoglycan-binding domain-containing protein [Aestuariibaculum suncheonense]|uniref:LysM peptidoglycan-binding domain-containing protein n=1 Tax=Aestuariibaculum suncheonense TaxID=1028745 RepID=A0A8J6Q8W0_9FLAO|nr:LysM peptidoglycan-binding domain-containing protein [Aestuariibaculum suncheonense]MBD0835901.1 LysM peptidoglycan-binding domain-containing protein [Aestuariibaculum suncheonense]